MVDAVNSGGLETTRMSAEEKEERQRREKQVDARGNLAAMMCERQAGAPSVRGLARPAKERIERAALEVVRAQPRLQAAAAEQWALLLEALGLDVVPAGRPGYCRREGCNQPLPMSAASPLVSSSSPHWKRGYCSPKCWTED
jgi:hypothetical protein